ncbi:hypothetical protein DQ384_38195 [Sphaerisporangium album]|uniref:Uncharacterized protein n=1 Tax=Sphaerisporangium album TaxID=509200 RepID=A0A367EMB5_9ACTN|nr:hypothetical protein [Sphaerisporangium album]RCG19113.1 hypothetical protein DQ384_38195 [Sphaerisporangium album]
MPPTRRGQTRASAPAAEPADLAEPAEPAGLATMAEQPCSEHFPAGFGEGVFSAGCEHGIWYAPQGEPPGDAREDAGGGGRQAPASDGESQ